MMSAFIVSQVLIGLSLLFDIASFQFRQRKFTLLFLVGASVLISAHYFLLGAQAAALIKGVSVIRYIVALYSTHPRLKYIFLALVTIVGALTFRSYSDLLPITAGYCVTFAVFQTNEKRLRELMMISSLLVITYNILIFTPIGVLTELFFLISVMFSYWRFYFLKEKTVV